jgi:hypothetical protein
MSVVTRNPDGTLNIPSMTGREGMSRLQVQDKWGRSPNDPNNGKPPQPGENVPIPNPGDGSTGTDLNLGGGDWWSQNAPEGYSQWAGQERGLNTQPPQQQPSSGGYQLAPSGDAPLMQNWTTPFQARDPNQIANDPSFKFQMDQGQQAIERSAAARGTLLTGGTMKGLARFGQGLASTFDDKYYNRDRGEYQQAYDIFNNNQTGQYNRLAGLAGLGQTSAGQLGGAGSSYGQSGGNTMTDIGNARAAGTVGSANAWNSALGGIANNVQYGMYPPYQGTPPYFPDSRYPGGGY